MIGSVNSQWEAILPIFVIGENGRILEVKAVIDTGYNGYITLPLATVSALALSRSATREVTLGDTTRKVFDYYTAEIIVGVRRQKVRVLCVEGDALIGTALLAGYRLEVDFIIGGSVTLRAIP